MGKWSYEDVTARLAGGRFRRLRVLNKPPHYHRQIELVYVEKGGLEFSVGGADYSLGENAFAVIRPFELHSFRSGNKGNRFYVVVLPDMLSVGLIVKTVQKSFVSSAPVDLRKLMSLYGVFNGLSNKYRLSVFRLFVDVIGDLCTGDAAGKSSSTVTEILNYINGHFTEKLTLVSVAAACATNRSYVSRAVNQEVGRGFNGYINSLRVEEFVRRTLASDGEESLEETALECGFSGARTFYRAFRAEFGCSPCEYFAKMRESGGRLE